MLAQRKADIRWHLKMHAHKQRDERLDGGSQTEFIIFKMIAVSVEECASEA